MRADPYIHITFTGSREGMSSQQSLFVRNYLFGCSKRVDPMRFVFHHGGAQGCDTEFDDLVGELLPESTVWRHIVPGPDSNWDSGDEGVIACSGHLARNRSMVLRSDAVLGCPPTFAPQMRGGTWYTLKYAAMRGTGKIDYISPAGQVGNVTMLREAIKGWKL